MSKNTDKTNIDRQAMLALYIRDAKPHREKSKVAQLAHVAMCHAILDGTMDYDPDTQMVSLTPYGLDQLERRVRGKRSGMIH